MRCSSQLLGRRMSDPKNKGVNGNINKDQFKTGLHGQFLVIKYFIQINHSF